jgi:putative SOS response-associated peptidase YedK
MYGRDARWQVRDKPRGVHYLPNALTSTINHERSPVLLTTDDEYSTWLTGTAEEAFGLIKTSDPEGMRIVQSGFDKEDLPAA